MYLTVTYRAKMNRKFINLLNNYWLEQMITFNYKPTRNDNIWWTISEVNAHKSLNRTFSIVQRFYNLKNHRIAYTYLAFYYWYSYCLSKIEGHYSYVVMYHIVNWVNSNPKCISKSNNGQQIYVHVNLNCDYVRHTEVNLSWDLVSHSHECGRKYMLTWSYMYLPLGN
jgi:hypothetical protein